MLLFSGLALVVALGMAAFAKWKVPSWRERYFGDRDFKWDLLIGVSATSSLVFSHLGFFLSDNLWVGLGIGMLGFLTVLSSITDFALMKIPRELTSVVQFVPLPFIALLWPSFDFYDQTAMILWGSIVFTFAVISFFGMFGWGDVKILVAVGTTLSWWVGPMYLTYALLGAAAFALILIPIAPRIGYGSYGLKKRIGEGTKWNADEKKLEAVEKEVVVKTAFYPIADNEPAISRFFKSLVNAFVKSVRNFFTKKKTFVPFGPALLIAFLVMSLVAAGTMEVTTFTFFDLPK